MHFQKKMYVCSRVCLGLFIALGILFKEVAIVGPRPQIVLDLADIESFG